MRHKRSVKRGPVAPTDGSAATRYARLKQCINQMVCQTSTEVTNTKDAHPEIGLYHHKTCSDLPLNLSRLPARQRQRQARGAQPHLAINPANTVQGMTAERVGALTRPGAWQADTLPARAQKYPI